MTNIPQSFVVRYDGPDEFIDDLKKTLAEADAPEVLIEMADKVLRPYLHILDKAQADKVEIDVMLQSTESMIATAVMNLIHRAVPPTQLDTAADMAQAFSDNVAVMLSDSIGGSFTMPSSVLLPH